jgi:hypothetical protein
MDEAGITSAGKGRLRNLLGDYDDAYLSTRRKRFEMTSSYQDVGWGQWLRCHNDWQVNAIVSASVWYLEITYTSQGELLGN